MTAPATLAEMPKAEIVTKLQRIEAAAKNLRAKTKHATRLGSHALLGVVGGAASGAIYFKMAKIPGTQIDSDLAIGTLLVLAALADMADGYDDELAALGAGMLAGAAARETTMLLQQREKEAK